jgi:hypothetical protein
MTQRLARALAWAGVALGLGTVFMAYLNPHRTLDLVNAFWACF